MIAKSSCRLVWGGMLLVACTACSAQQAVILVPDHDGQVGKVEVATEGGSQVLDRANQMTVVSDRSTSPSRAGFVDQKYIQSTFGEALAAEPLPAEKFTLLFDTGTTSLRPESQAAIETIVSRIKERGAISVKVSGHTDSVGSTQLNDQLARNRAQAVRDLLAQRGVDPGLLSVTSHGKGNPLVSSPDGVPEPRNRRVEVIVR